ncbi:MAG TPA: hypothetical protein VNZ52_11885 [Candidatus Thermoplasmatota archaeon]|nr:hypothetical protein [Candidatus Thermoplasmatota archaeon]
MTHMATKNEKGKTVFVLLLVALFTAAPVVSAHKTGDLTDRLHHPTVSIATPLPDETVPGPEPQILYAAGDTGEASVTSTCSPDGGSSSGLEFVQTYEPFGSSGYNVDHNNNVYIRWYACRTTYADTQGYKYVFLQYKETLNAAPGNHVWSYWDRYDHTQKAEWTPGTGESIVDIDPNNHVNLNEQTHTFSLGYAGASLGWSLYFSDVDIYQEYWTGDKVRWRTEENSAFLNGKSSFTLSYGAVWKVPKGTHADIKWYSEFAFHHADATNEHRHGYGTPCYGVGCGYNTFSVWVPA